jgi:hypothetical protein
MPVEYESHPRSRRTDRNCVVVQWPQHTVLDATHWRCERQMLAFRSAGYFRPRSAAFLPEQRTPCVAFHQRPAVEWLPMAKSKTKSTKTPTKARAARATKAAAPKAVGRKKAALAPAARRSLLRPRTGAVDLAFELVKTWGNERGLRVDGLTPAKLRAAALRARKAGDRRTQLEEKQARQLQPVVDAQLLADDALWRGLLALRAAVGLRERLVPGLEDRFSSLVDALKNRRPPAAAASPPVAPKP